MRMPLFGEIHIVSRKPFVPFGDGIIDHVGNLEDINFVKRLAELKFDRLIHLAWVGLPELSPENNNLNLRISKEFIKIMVQSGVSEVNLTGSCLEYGELDVSVSEDSIGINIGQFGECKLELLQFIQELRIPYRWLRIFYAYGPNQHANSLLSAAFEKAKMQIPFYPKDPTAARDFVFVDDVASAFLMLLKKDNAHGIFNVGSGKSTGVTEILSLLYSRLDSIPFDTKVSRKSLHADWSKIQAACGWEPKVDLLEGVNRFIDWRERQ